MLKIKELLNRYKELILYLIFGVLTTAVSFAVQWLFKDVIVLPYAWLTTVIAWFCSVLFAFITNKLIVFESKKKQGFFKEFFLFYGSRLFTGLVEIGAMALFVDICHFNYWAIKIIANVLIIILNYILSKFIVFKKDKTR